MSYEKLPAVEGSIACLTCGAGARSDLEPDRWLAVGFGSVDVTRDGECIYSESDLGEDEEPPTAGDIETRAKADPDHDWRIAFFAPMYEAEYQRQAEGVWVLVRKGEGFA